MKRFNFSLRIFSFFILVTIFAVAAVIMSIVAEKTVITAYKAIEHAYALKEMQQIQETFKENLAELYVKTIDWGNWSDMYEFAQSRSPKFIENNITPETIKDMKLNNILIMDTAGKLIHGEGIDSSTGNKPDVSAGLIRLIQSDPHISTAVKNLQDTSGIFVLDGTLVMVSIRQIHEADGGGPSRGSVIFIREIDEGVIDRVRQITHAAFDLRIYTAGDTIASERDSKVIVASEDQLHVHGVLVGLAGKPVGIITSRFMRYITKIGWLSLKQTRDIFIVLSIFMTAVILFFQDTVILRPLLLISERMKKIGQTRSFGDRIPFVGMSEIGDLSVSINNMLQDLYSSHIEKESHLRDLHKSRHDLQEQLQRSDQQNASLIESKQAMLNILSDAQELERSLEAEKERAQTVIASVGEGLIVVDMNGSIERINPVAEQLIGVPSRDAIGKDMRSLFELYRHGMLVPKEERYISLTLREGKPQRALPHDEVTIRIQTGKTIPISVLVTPLLHEGELTGAVVILQDVTDILAFERALEEAKKSVEQKVIDRTKELIEKNTALENAQKEISEGWLQLEREKARLTASILGLDIGFILGDANGKILVANAVAKNGLNLQEHVESMHDVAVACSEGFDLKAQMDRCRDHKIPIAMEDVLIGGKYMRIYIAPIILSKHEDEFLGTVILIEDRTEAKVLARARDEFFSIASHELRTPLTAIRGNTSLIMQYYKKNLDEDPELSEMINDIKESSVRLINIVNEFLNMSRLEQKRIDFKKEPVDIHRLLEAAVMDMEATAKEKNISLIYEHPGDPLPIIHTDQGRVKEVLYNLIGNAIKYTDTGGIIIDTQIRDGFLEIRVHDTGKGISLVNQPLLFRKFQQASDNLYTRDTSQSTGLGLYISRLIIEAMGGSIRLVSSEIGVGSVFAFTVPVE